MWLFETIVHNWMYITNNQAVCGTDERHRPSADRSEMSESSADGRGAIDRGCHHVLSSPTDTETCTELDEQLCYSVSQ